MIKFNDKFLMNDNYLKSFYPMRLILRKNSFDKCILKTINPEYLFLINNTFPVKYSSLMYNGLGLKRSYLIFQEIEISLNFMRDGCDNEYINNTIEEMRLSLQNFIYGMEYKSFYIAATEYRRILECVMWMDVILTQENELEINKIIEKNDLTDEINYSEFFKNKSNDLYNAWKFCSKITHGKENCVFHINEIYRDKCKIVIDDFLKIISDTSGKIRNAIINFFDIFDKNIYIERYKKILNKLESSRKKINDEIIYDSSFIKLDDNLIHFDDKLKQSYPFNSTPNSQEILEKASNNSISNEEKLKMLILYSGGLLMYLDHYKIQEGEMYLSEFSIMNEIYWNDLVHIRVTWGIAEDYLLSFIKKLKLDNLEKEMENRVNNLYMYPFIYTIISILSSLFLIELNQGTNYKINIFRTMIEDYFIMILIQKKDNYGLINCIVEYAMKNFGYKIDKKIRDEIIMMKHVRPTQRVMYYSTLRNEVSGCVEKGYDNVELIIKILFHVFDYCVLDNKKFLNENLDILKEVDFMTVLEMVLIYKISLEKLNIKSFEDVYNIFLDFVKLPKEVIDEIFKNVNAKQHNDI